MWGKLNLPMFLFNVGLLTPIKIDSLVSTSIMDKWQKFIDMVSELRFLKIKEILINKFNRLLLKKQGNITWFSAVPPYNQATLGRVCWSSSRQCLFLTGR